jgi:hypothetical protein
MSNRLDETVIIQCLKMAKETRDAIISAPSNITAKYDGRIEVYEALLRGDYTK